MVYFRMNEDIPFDFHVSGTRQENIIPLLYPSADFFVTIQETIACSVFSFRALTMSYFTIVVMKKRHFCVDQTRAISR